jgi:iron complex transport system permease protein
VQIFGLLQYPRLLLPEQLITVLVVYLLARIGQFITNNNLILAGVAVGSFASALTSFMMLRSQGELRRAVAWLLGGSTLSGWQPAAALPYIVTGLGVLCFSGYALNVLQFGDDQARQLGLPVERTKALLLGAASLATAAAVSFSGVIGFVG